MATQFIAVDLETTGLVPARDAIIEVGIVRFADGKVLEEWSSLVNPYQSIPPFITQLTGIKQAMVDDAPDIFSLRDELDRKLDRGILVGHNVGFDLGFLNEDNFALRSHRVDTSVLASILYPTRGSYGLSSLSRFLELRKPDDEKDHRALGDARRTYRLFVALQEKARQLDFSILEELVRAGQQLNWPETIFFEEAWKQVGKEAFGKGGRLQRLYQPAKVVGSSLIPADQPEQLDGEIISGLLEPGGEFEKRFPGYEHRPQQVEMIQAVTEAFNKGRHFMIEAGTGTGKSIGYLLPAAFWSDLNERRVVVSTNTINLQDQLINKDLPQLNQLLPFPIRSAVLKGRRNYLCTRLFQQLRHRGPGSADEMALFGRILVWLPESEIGDQAEISLRSTGERLAWDRINSENEACTAEKCAAEGCPLHYARRRAELAHILVVNHALLLADVASENRVLPEYRDLIMDEAHHLESAITNGLSFRSDKRYIESLLDEVTRARSGLLAVVRNMAVQSLPAEVHSVIESRLLEAQGYAQESSIGLEEFFSQLELFLEQFLGTSSPYSQQIRITPALRSQPDYDQVLISYDNLDKQLSKTSDALARLASQVADISYGFDVDDIEDMRLALVSLAKNFSETRENINAIISQPTEDMIYWAEAYRNRLSLHAAPLHIGSLVEEHIFNAKETVVLTSATLRTAAPGYQRRSNFDYLRSRLHANHVEDLAVGSPFNYKDSTLLYLPTDMPEPNQPGYQRCVEQAVVDIAQSIGGRTLVLFTSYSQLNTTANAIESGLKAKGITLTTQSEGASRERLLEQFKAQDEPIVLLGTRSFWEGIDVPGAALQAVLIVKLPFDVPSDPIVAARSETFENPFFEYTIPEAVLRFRQGFGRLIRRQDDEGIVVVLDKRVLTKRYGQAFLDALPECTVLRQRLDRIGELSKRWLDREK